MSEKLYRVVAVKVKPKDAPQEEYGVLMSHADALDMAHKMYKAIFNGNIAPGPIHHRAMAFIDGVDLHGSGQITLGDSVADFYKFEHGDYDDDQ